MQNKVNTSVQRRVWGRVRTLSKALNGTKKGFRKWPMPKRMVEERRAIKRETAKRRRQIYIDWCKRDWEATHVGA